MKTLVSYICHYVNEASIARYEVIKNGMIENYDIIYVIPNALEEVNVEELLGDIEYGYYEIDKNHECFNMKNNYHYNNNLTYCKVYEEFGEQYDNFYFIEHDCLFKDNVSSRWTSFFNSYEREGIDLLCCHFEDYDAEYQGGLYSIDHMIAMNTTKGGKVMNDGMIMVDNQLMVSDIKFAFMPLCKISKALMEKVHEYYSALSEICPFFEYVIPTLAVKNDMSIVDFETEYTQYIAPEIDNVHWDINGGSMSWYLEDKSKYDDNVLIHPLEC